MSRQILSITQVNDYIRSKLDSDALLMGVAVSGEISNYKVYPSGHHYFTLKDENAALKCVMFRSSTVHLRFKPENGMKVIAMGKISVYPRDGAYQLYCNSMMVDGVGDLHAAFEQLKVKLAAKGYFEQEHKKAIPKFPDRIGIITSAAGAALHDMLRIINARYPLSEVILLPVRVQGSEAPGEISDAITLANAMNIADVLIVGRGGGSIEDLWAFNDERVAHAIYASQIPIISAVGHEPDVTISDYVADLRAATPSNAAELVVPDKNALTQTLDKLQQAIVNMISQQLRAAQQQLKVLSSSSVLLNPQSQIQIKRDALLQLCDRMRKAQELCISINKESFARAAAKLDAMSPLKVLQRGYSFVKNDSEKIVRTVKDVAIGKEICVMVTDGSIYATVDDILEDPNNESIKNL